MNQKNIDYKNLIKQVYCPPPGEDNWQLEDFIGHANIRYFSFARYALKEALQIAGIGKYDKVLLPELICRELLSSVNSIGALPVYYPVDKNLQMSAEPDELPRAGAILAVNYFGFPQNLAPFRDYCKRTGAVLIEDNAHGLFSRDQNGQPLGSRGDFSIFSLRKSLAVPDGAALVLNSRDLEYKLNPQAPFNKQAETYSFKIKQAMRKLEPWVGITPLIIMISSLRYIRRIRTGSEFISSTPDAEFVLPNQSSACEGLLSYLSSVNVAGEIKRRRNLYLWLDNLLENSPCEPILKELTNNVVPYGYPFYASYKNIGKIKKHLKKYWLYCFQWPELPSAVLPSAPQYYKTIWVVSFL